MGEKKKSKRQTALNICTRCCRHSQVWTPAENCLDKGRDCVSFAAMTGSGGEVCDSPPAAAAGATQRLITSEDKR